MKHTIFKKIFSSYFLLIVFLALIILLVSFSAIRSFYLDTLARDLEHLGKSLIVETTPYVLDREFKRLDTFVKAFGKSIDTRITIIDKEGKVLADSEEDPAVMEDHGFRPEIIRALGGNVGRSLRFSRTVKERMLYVGLPIERGGKIEGVLRVSLFTKDINNLLLGLGSRIVLITGVVLALAILAAYFFSRSLSLPIKNLKDASHRVATGDYAAKVYLKNKDEFKELADSFNFMTEKLKALFDELSIKREQLSGILNSMEAGLLTLSREERILLANRSFEKIMRSGPVEGKFSWEAIREPGFDRLIKNVRQKRGDLDTEIVLDGRVFHCRAVFLGESEEIAVTFSDVTHQKNVEKIKKDFVANVSHELRTPLTAIKGFVETLEEGVKNKENRNYLDIIKRHTDRLINIINDLLVLSEMEGKEFKPEMEEVDINDLIEQVLKIFEKKIKEKRLELQFLPDAETPAIKGDPFLLEQLFMNLLDNAIKYTEKGKIAITVERGKDDLLIKIKDSGIGIPEEHRSRIYERFYVIDKSRSRLLGGTGLGLSIVKHITLLHKGRINVDSRFGEGTTFTVSLPVWA
jgi:two-component system phosphate regulon sensor histidine kinase PhoR